MPAGLSSNSKLDWPACIPLCVIWHNSGISKTEEPWDLWESWQTVTHLDSGSSKTQKCKVYENHGRHWLVWIDNCVKILIQALTWVQMWMQKEEPSLSQTQCGTGWGHSVNWPTVSYSSGPWFNTGLTMDEHCTLLPSPARKLDWVASPSDEGEKCARPVGVLGNTCKRSMGSRKSKKCRRRFPWLNWHD